MKVMGEELVGAPIAHDHTFVVVKLETNSTTVMTDGIDIFLESGVLLLTRYRHKDFQINARAPVAPDRYVMNKSHYYNQTHLQV
jgi:hypothetical protein